MKCSLDFESWNKNNANSISFGYHRQQEKLGKEKEEIEQQRKLLTKKKPPTPQSATAKANKAKAAMANGPDDVFAKPAVETPMTPLEYYERDEIFKLRLASLRKVRL